MKFRTISYIASLNLLLLPLVKGEGGEEVDVLRIAAMLQEKPKAPDPKENEKGFHELDTKDLLTYVKIGEPKEKYDAVLELWFRHEEDALKLAWWEGKDRDVRALIVACYSFTNEPTSAVYPFESLSLRFADEEKDLRVAESKMVYRNLKKLAGAIHQWALFNLDPKQLDENKPLLEGYEITARGK